jgi:hypothetical protein
MTYFSSQTFLISKDGENILNFFLIHVSAMKIHYMKLYCILHTKEMYVILSFIRLLQTADWTVYKMMQFTVHAAIVKAGCESCSCR